MLSSDPRRRVSQTLCDPHMDKSHKVVGEAEEAGSCLAVGEGRLIVLRTTFFSPTPDLSSTFILHQVRQFLPQAQQRPGKAETS